MRLSLRNILSAAFILLLLASIPVAAETPDKPVTFDDLEWMTGRWIGSAFGGTCEEVWSPEIGGSMTGTFKLVVDGKVGFYELMVITIDDDGPRLTLKHFNADMTGWEEKDDVITFPFKCHSYGLLEFDGLSYQKNGADSLKIVVVTGGADGKTSEHVIECARAQ